MPEPEPKPNGDEPVAEGWPKGDDAEAGVRLNPVPFRIRGSGLFPLRSIPVLLTGLLSSVMLISPSSFLGGVVGAAAPFGAGVPKSVEPAGVGVLVDADAPKTNPGFSAVGVDGAGVPNANGDFAGSGAEVVEG